MFKHAAAGARRRWPILVLSVVSVSALALSAFTLLASADQGRKLAVRPPGITQTSIGGARLGLFAPTYKKLLGKSVYRLPLNQPNGRPTGWSRLVFGTRGLSVYFPPRKTRAVVITTWDRRYKTAAGIGPCTTIAELKLTYGSRIKPSKFNTQHGVVFAYTLGKNLIFASNNHSYVEVVGLYNGSDPNVGKPGGSLPWAGYITLSDRTCNRT